MCSLTRNGLKGCASRSCAICRYDAIGDPVAALQWSGGQNRKWPLKGRCQELAGMAVQECVKYQQEWPSEARNGHDKVQFLMVFVLSQGESSGIQVRFAVRCSPVRCSRTSSVLHRPTSSQEQPPSRFGGSVRTSPVRFAFWSAMSMVVRGLNGAPMKAQEEPVP